MQKVQLSDALTDFNLHQAWSKVYENQGCAGVDRQTLELFAVQLHKNLEALRDEVNYETYQAQPLFRIDLDKPGGGTRPLSIPTVRDRVLQTAVTRVIEPLFEAEFEDCSFAYRKGRSVDQALVLLCQIIYKLVIPAGKRVSSAMDGKLKSIRGVWIPAIPAGMTILDIVCSLNLTK